MPITKKTRSYPRKKKVGRKTRVLRGIRRAPVAEVASCKETQTFTLLNPNVVYNNYNTQLSSFNRAVTIAEGYQFYRIKKITYKFSPLSDTFQNGTGTTVPYLYFMMDRLRQLRSANTVDQVRLLGAKPRRMDDKIVTWSYTPSVLVGNYDALPPGGQLSTQFTQYKVSPWLSCRDWENNTTWVPDSTDHLGCIWVMENSGGLNVPYKCERIVEFEFKKPAYTLTPVQGAPDPIDVEDLVVQPQSVPSV